MSLKMAGDMGDRIYTVLEIIAESGEMGIAKRTICDDYKERIGKGLSHNVTFPNFIGVFLRFGAIRQIEGVGRGEIARWVITDLGRAMLSGDDSSIETGEVLKKKGSERDDVPGSDVIPDEKNDTGLEEVFLIEEIRLPDRTEIKELITIIDSYGEPGTFKTTETNWTGLPGSVDKTSKIRGYLKGILMTEIESTQRSQLSEFLLEIKPFMNRRVLWKDTHFQSMIKKIEKYVNSFSSE